MKTSACVRYVVMCFAPWLMSCASTSGATPTPVSPSPAAAASSSNRICPAQVPGSTVQEEDVEGGAALVFTTSHDNVSDVRQNVRDIAAIYNHHATGQELDRPEHEARSPDDPYLAMPDATASVQDIEHGARLLIKPDDPKQLATVRARANMHAAYMVNGECLPL